jgi:hypothetical protein
MISYHRVVTLTWCSVPSRCTASAVGGTTRGNIQKSKTEEGERSY